MLSGIIEMDECYIGGKPRKEAKDKDDDGNYPTNKLGHGTKKECVVGMIERDDDVKAKHMAKTLLKGINLQELVRKNVKLHVVKNIIIACAGDDILMTLFLNYLTNEYKKTEYKNSDEMASSIITGFQKYWNELYILPLRKGNDIEMVNNIPIYNDPISNALINNHFNNIMNNFSGMIAFEFNNNHFLYAIKGLNPPVMIRSNGLWYHINGSGELTALPSIHLIKKILNIQVIPSIDKGIQLSYWTIKHAIEVTSGGIGGNITLKKLAKQNKEYIIEDVDTTGAEEYIQNMYSHVYEFHTQVNITELAPKLN